MPCQDVSSQVILPLKSQAKLAINGVKWSIKLGPMLKEYDNWCCDDSWANLATGYRDILIAVDSPQWSLFDTKTGTRLIEI